MLRELRANSIARAPSSAKSMGRAGNVSDITRLGKNTSKTAAFRAALTCDNRYYRGFNRPRRGSDLGCWVGAGRPSFRHRSTSIAQGYATLGQIGFADRSGYTAIGT